MIDDDKRLRIGDILLQEGIVTPAQLQDALMAQRVDDPPLPLGEVCIMMKLISRQDLRHLLRKYKTNIQLGELLINMGLINEEQLDEALQHKEISGSKLGEILMELNYLTEGALIDAVSIQLGYPKILPSMSLIDRGLMKGLNSSFLKRNRALPAFKENDVITVIMADPLNLEIIEILRMHFRAEIEVAVATTEEITTCIDLYFKESDAGSGYKNDKDLIIGDTRLSDEGDDNIVEVLNFIITNAIHDRASDIHIEPSESKLRVRFRIDGILFHKTDLPLSINRPLVSRMKVLCKMDIAEKRRNQDGFVQARVQNKEVDLRISTYPSLWGESVVVRIQSKTSGLTDLSVLGFTPYNLAVYQSLLDLPAGIIMVTGPAGSGKTTTLYASVYYLQAQNKKIITAEDPIESNIDGVTQGQVDRHQVQTYSDFLKAMLRQDPDVIMIGEVRDKIAAATVVDGALSGHKVLTTFHTEDTTGALLRLLDTGVEAFLLSSTTISVVSQRLVRTLCQKCRKEYEPEEALLRQFSSFTLESLTSQQFFTPRGCHECNYTGYMGRTSLHEILTVNDATRGSLLQRQASDQLRKIARTKGGLISMREDGVFKASRGITSLEEVLRLTPRNKVDESLPRDFSELSRLSERVHIGPSGTVRISSRMTTRETI